MTKTVNLKLRLTEDVHDELKRRAALNERTVAAEIRLALRNWLALNPTMPA